MLSLRAVNQFYGSQHTLWNVNIDFPQGICTGIVGLPGMGKSTLMNCITGKVPVESGTIIWHEAGAPPRNLLSPASECPATPTIGYVPQDRRIFSQLTVDENLHIAMRATGKPDPALKNEVYALFPELYTLRQIRASTLSPDDQYQLALASALVNRPRVLILDEPMHGAGQRFARRLGQLLVRLNRELGMTVLLAEQQLSFIRRVADRFCMLYRGRNVAQGHVNELDDDLIAHWMGRGIRR
ncbi:ATP-binding cassette domain-containing protein [Enterobacter cloacae]|uniref:ABC transporter ATP-binding protein n=1 Tax=Enterobacter TaxID=547 RepID=UPI000D1D1648|nr:MULTISPECIES: ATP-binding cassette domain-containing protein [Enterobacter]MBJ6385692.1 ATP-binding cassette domain-containing protein [Enterobacter cloacae]MBJ6403560.1 ATP-binding cassette domain-containing protein [Enterobacter cloacae]MBJ6432990.1 ATP-binding cassette domain-containing protein [Enterobacter cloacae]MBJ6455640.1 ATP-binding cassette domain-containing protein [Enterobacter cloacae]MBJ6486498.1 ATP-binding cassette domain-containing protein [Enterobacter cloacae]